jgi:type I restriction enzyme S subunit
MAKWINNMTTNGIGTRPLPDGWTLTPFGELFEIQGGSQPPKETFIYEPKSGYIRLLQIRDFGDKPVPTYIPIEDANKTCESKDILIARYGASLGRILTGMEGAYNVAMAKVIFDRSLINNRYVFYLLQTPVFQTPIHMISRSAQNGFNKGDIYPIELPLAPLAEQERIVAEIEKQFTRLDQAVVSLRRLQTNLSRYKASVLKSACEGRLVPQDPTDEPASELLQRILSERRNQWQTTHPGKKYPEPTSVDTSNLPNLPEGWVWATVEQVAANEPNSITDGPFGSKLKTAHYTEAGPRVIRLQNIGNGEFVDEKAHISDEHYDSLKKHRVFAGDLVIAGLGVSLPRSCIIPDFVGLAIVKADCIRVKPHPEIALGKYLNAALNSEPLKKFATNIVHGIGRPRLNQQEIKSLAIPLPSLAEQQRIVAEVERRLSVITATEQAITLNLARAERLRQSILHRAFTGQLV